MVKPSLESSSSTRESAVLEKRRLTSERKGRRPDGRSCDLCGAKDDSSDPVDFEVLKMHVALSWGYPAMPDG